MIPRTDASIDEAEGRKLVEWCKKSDVRTVLEFGPGYSTNFFLEAGCKVTCAESDAVWIEHFKQYPESKRVELVMFKADEIPLAPWTYDMGLRFDIAFIDAPRGDIFPASRINTALFAWRRCRFIAMHDTNRPGERLTVNILKAIRCRVMDEYQSARGMTLLQVL
jgi:hypothetical protein